VGADQSGVEHDVVVVGIVDQTLENLLPDARVRPAAEALMDGFVLAVALGKIVPVCSGAQHPENSVHKQPIVSARAPRIALLARKQIFNPPPLRIRQFIPPGHPTSSRFDSGNS